MQKLVLPGPVASGKSPNLLEQSVFPSMSLPMAKVVLCVKVSSVCPKAHLMGK